MFGLDADYTRKFATLFALAAAVTAVGVRFTMYEIRRGEDSKRLEVLEERIAEFSSTVISRAERDDYHTQEINRLRDRVNELYSRER